jgi:hypothetical protein
MQRTLVPRLLDALRMALPRFPDVPALTALLSQLTYSTAPLRTLGSRSTFRTLFCRCLRTWCAHACLVNSPGRCWRSSCVQFVRTPETGWAAAGAPRGGSGTTATIAMLANALLAALNGLRQQLCLVTSPKCSMPLCPRLFGALFEGRDGVSAAVGAVCEEGIDRGCVRIRCYECATQWGVAGNDRKDGSVGK